MQRTIPIVRQRKPRPINQIPVMTETTKRRKTDPHCALRKSQSAIHSDEAQIPSLNLDIVKVNRHRDVEYMEVH